MTAKKEKYESSSSKYLDMLKAKLAKKEKFDDTTNAAATILGIGLGIFIFIIIWCLLGLAAFVVSLVCIGRSGSTGAKILGVVLALFLGPLYFLMFLVPSYCRAGPRHSHSGGSARRLKHGRRRH
jgi:hypothetical protein